MTQSSGAKSSIYAPGSNAAVVRYQVQDVDRTGAFYTRHLGFHLTYRVGPIAIVTRGDLNLLLSGADASGSRPMPGGGQQEPGGWNRIVLYVDNLDAMISDLKGTNVHFRNDVESGPGGKQILIDDPDGNPVELHEAPKH